ncbi:hypothetical protein BDV06DRAFT_226643 [Aspergillus oleicola]
MNPYVKNGRFNDNAFDNDVKRNKSLFQEIVRMGVRYDFGSHLWDLDPYKQEVYRKELLELGIIQLSRKYADVETLRRTWPEVHRIREKGREALKNVDEQFESLYKELHGRWIVVEQIWNLEEKLFGKWKWWLEERNQNLGRRAGIDMTMDALYNFEQKLGYVFEIWKQGGQASIDMSLSYLQYMSRKLCGSG